MRLLWSRLSDAERKIRADMLAVASDFHRMELFVWLFRDATEDDRQFFAEFALENRLADGLLLAVESGLRVWSTRARELARAWPAAAGLAFSDPPEGAMPDAGWSVSLSGVTSTLAVGGNGGTIRVIRRRVGLRSRSR
jgi:hypothetical protein